MNPFNEEFSFRYGYDVGSTRRRYLCDNTTVLGTLPIHKGRAPRNVESIKGVASEEPMATGATAEYRCELFHIESFRPLQLYERRAGRRGSMQVSKTVPVNEFGYIRKSASGS